MTTIGCFCGAVFTPMFGPAVCPECGEPPPEGLPDAQFEGGSPDGVRFYRCTAGDCQCGECPELWPGD